MICTTDPFEIMQILPLDKTLESVSFRGFMTDTIVCIGFQTGLVRFFDLNKVQENAEDYVPYQIKLPSCTSAACVINEKDNLFAIITEENVLYVVKIQDEAVVQKEGPPVENN